MSDKNQAVIDYLLQCPQIAANSLYFQYGELKDNSKQIITQGNDKSLNHTYIDGSILKRFTFTIIDYRSIVAQAIPKVANITTENVEEILDVQAIIDWISEQEDLRNYPDFGNDCEIQEIRAVTENPNLNGIDTSMSIAMAKYSVSIQIEYLDISKTIWDKT